MYSISRRQKRGYINLYLPFRAFTNLRIYINRQQSHPQLNYDLITSTETTTITTISIHKNHFCSIQTNLSSIRLLAIAICTKNHLHICSHLMHKPVWPVYTYKITSHLPSNVILIGQPVTMETESIRVLFRREITSGVETRPQLFYN